MTHKSLTIGLIVVAIISIGGYFFPQIQGAFGEVTGTTNYDNLELGGTLAVTGATTLTGGATFSSTVANNGAVTNNSSVIYSSATSSSAIPSTYTVVQADLLTNNTVIAGLAAASTWTLPATSTLTSMIPAAGDSQTFCVLAYYNSLTFVAGTGMDFEVATTTTDVFGVPSKVIPANGRGCLTFTRATTTDVNVGFVRFSDGD